MLKVLQETSSISVTSVAPEEMDDAVMADWQRLFEAQPTPSNPFLSPIWVQHWYRNFVPSADRRVVLVRRRTGDSPPGELMGIAPMYVNRRRLGPARLVDRMLPAGAGVGSNPYEIPGLLCDGDHVREVTKAVTSACLGVAVDWCELPLAPHQSWFDWDWLKSSTAGTTFGEEVRTRACVILPLQPSWPETRTTLKRNIKESIRRSANRLKKDGRSWEVVRRGADLDSAAVERFLHLHRVRSRLGQGASQHPDAYAQVEHRGLMIGALPQLGREGQASMFELYLDGEHVASQLGLHSPGTSYVHSSGFREDTWELGVVTHLQAELIRYAIDRGDSVVNFSPGPSVSKLRWSERLWVTHEFAFGAGPRSLPLRFSAFQAISVFKTLRQAAARHQEHLSRRTG